MTITIEELKALLNKMEETKTNEVELDFDMNYENEVYGVDFDRYVNGVFKETLFTKEKD